MANNIKNKHFH